MIKKIIISLAFLITLTSATALCEDKYKGYELPIDIEINGSFIKCDVKSFLKDGVTYIPLRSLSNAIDGQIFWNEETYTATMSKDNHTFSFCSEEAFSTIDGATQNCNAINYKNLTFVPVRIISETLNYTVEWDDTYMVVKITAPNIIISDDCKDNSYTMEDITYLSKITMLESGSGGLDMKIAICNTILNRVKSTLFPNTIKGVIFDTKYGTQFPPAHTDMINKTPSRECFIAAKCALNGVTLAGNSLYFISTKAAPKSWAHKNRPFYRTIGNTNFYE